MQLWVVPARAARTVLSPPSCPSGPCCCATSTALASNSGVHARVPLSELPWLCRRPARSASLKHSRVRHPSLVKKAGCRRRCRPGALSALHYACRENHGPRQMVLFHSERRNDRHLLESEAGLGAARDHAKRKRGAPTAFSKASAGEPHTYQTEGRIWGNIQDDAPSPEAPMYPLRYRLSRERAGPPLLYAALSPAARPCAALTFPPPSPGQPL